MIGLTTTPFISTATVRTCSNPGGVLAKVPSKNQWFISRVTLETSGVFAKITARSCLPKNEKIYSRLKFKLI